MVSSVKSEVRIRYSAICYLLPAICCLAFAAPGLRTEDCGLRTVPAPGRTDQEGPTRLTSLSRETRGLPAFRLPPVAYRLSPTGYRLSPTGTDSVVRDDYLVNDDQTGGGTHQAAKCGFDAQGNCVVAWEDYRNGDADALAQRFNFDGTRDGVNFRACDDGDMWWQGEPAVGAKNSGDYRG